ncbi:MAG: aminotransferase class V-fold PLP-dependent enzyme [Firmicutes bacterium]|nr:aminotransferase class V-fold PLP-dependent enzyme [Bacillota bacterium]
MKTTSVIYLDNAATTRIRPNVLDAINNAEQEFYYNSAAVYNGSLVARHAIEQATMVIKSRLAKSGLGQLIFTSGATEGNNMVILGKITSVRNHLVVLAGEHSSVYAPSVYLKNADFDVDYVPLKSNGEADINALARLIRPTTALVVFGLVNSDIGIIQNASEIVRTIRQINPITHIHCDAVQGFCTFDFDVQDLGIDSVVVSAHKIYGPKGIGALWLRQGTTIKPIMYGGSQQDFRPGTENNPSIIGFASAVASFNTQDSFNHITTLRNHLVNNLPNGCTLNSFLNSIPQPQLGNFPQTAQSPYITNIVLPNGILGNTVMNALSQRNIFVGIGSACASKSAKNRTLLAMGISEAKSKSVLRISLGQYNTLDEINIFLVELQSILNDLR